MDLIDAVREKENNLVKELLEAGADPNFVEDSHNITPLHYAVSYRNLEAIPMLVTAGGDIHIKDIDGRTPLNFAQELHDMEAQEILLKLESNCVSKRIIN